MLFSQYLLNIFKLGWDGSDSDLELAAEVVESLGNMMINDQNQKTEPRSMQTGEEAQAKADVTVTQAKGEDTSLHDLTTDDSNKIGFKLSFRKRMNQLREEKIGLDLELVVGLRNEEVFNAHKIMFANASPFFYSAIYGRKSKVTRLRIPECEPDVFRTIFEFIYKGEYGPEADMMRVIESVECANSFGISEFSVNINDFIRGSLSYENIFDFLGSRYFRSLARLEKMELASVCTGIINSCTEKVLEHNLHKLDLSPLWVILDSPGLDIDEISLFKFVLKWSKLQCQKKGLEPTPANLRKIGNTVFLKVRIPIIPTESFETTVVPSGILTEAEIEGVRAYRSSKFVGLVAGGFSTFPRLGRLERHIEELKHSLALQH